MYHLAIDIGASGGKHILGCFDNGTLSLTEVYRFENGLKNENGTLVWDVDELVKEVKKGIAKCHENGTTPDTIAIDTWGVDYVLLDSDGQEILPAVAYRDGRTEAAARELADILPQALLYEKTGIQKQVFNTLYQLYCDRQSGKLARAKYFLMMPDYLNYKLTGVMKNEYTNATTTNLVNAQTKDWDTDILDAAGIPREIFLPLSLPATEVGPLSEAVQKELGFNATVIHCPSHDTASAVAACPVDDESVYISSGTWSLIGTENTRPVLSRAAQDANFTNEGGIEHRFRFLKNIMGMWMFQNIRRDLNKQYTYDQMMHMAESSCYSERVDLTDNAFLAPENMIEAVRRYLGEPALPLCDVLASVYHSLAYSYNRAVADIESICGKRIRSIYIVGGGSKDAYLNRLTARYTGRAVYTGLFEATAVGNILSQVMFREGKTLAEARELIKNTLQISEGTR